jgi:hypothetical protein
MGLIKASESSSSVSRLYRYIAFAVLMAFALIGPSACNFSPFSDDDNSMESGEARREDLKTDVTVEDARNLAKPPAPGEGISVNPIAVNSGETDSPLQPAHGLSGKRLFADTLRDDEARLKRLEDAVQAMRDEFDSIKPSINRLMAVESDIQELVGQLNTLVGTQPPQNEEITVSQLDNNQAAIDRALGADGTAATEQAAAEASETGETPQSPPATPPATATGEPLQIAPPPPPMAPATTPLAQAPPPPRPEPGQGAWPNDGDSTISI